MAVRILKPTSPGRRRASTYVFAGLSKKRPEKALTESLHKQAGRNNQGKISVRHRGGGHKRLYRIIDFMQERLDQPAEVVSLEYDPNRTANIALVKYADGEKRYILAPDGLKVGQQVVSSRNQAEITVGNRLPLEKIPTGLMVHNIELAPGRGGAIVRSAGTAAQLMAVEGEMAQLKFPSGEVRHVPKASQATIGQVSNVDHDNVRLGKAGRLRWLGVRPTVRGKAMNPVDHPHGGGEGLQPIGLKHPKTPWGKPALGVKTRRAKKYSNRFIVKRRK